MDPMLTVVIVLLGVVVLMALIAFLGSIWPLKRRVPTSPYSNMPMRRANTLRYTTQYLVKRYLKEMEDFDNRQFNLNRAAVCRETGRIFPNAVNWTGKIHVDWNFLQKRMPGSWVSYGSLPGDRRQDLWDKHGTLEGFQTEFSSANPLPQDVEEELNPIKPGPLYVNLENNLVMGWKIVPGTEVEVLVVKRPIIHI